MTISVIGRVSAPADLEMEAISTERGVETGRTRHKDGDSVSLTVYGSKTLILREVPVGSELDLKPGEQRHGELDATNPKPAPGQALEESGLDPIMVESMEAEEAAAERVLDLAHQLVDADGDDSQQAVYAELRQAVQAHIGAVDRLDAYQSGQAS